LDKIINNVITRSNVDSNLASGFDGDFFSASFKFLDKTGHVSQVVSRYTYLFYSDNSKRRYYKENKMDYSDTKLFEIFP